MDKKIKDDDLVIEESGRLFDGLHGPSPEGKLHMGFEKPDRVSVPVEPTEERLTEIQEYVEATFSDIGEIDWRWVYNMIAKGE